MSTKNPTAKILFFCFLSAFYYFYPQSTWQTLMDIPPNTNNQRFDDIFLINDQIGWAANGNYATVYKTIDGGINWTEQLNENEIEGNFYFRNIEFLNEFIGFLGTLNGKTFKTLDGGSNWEVITNISPNPPAICGLSAVGESTIYGCGAYFSPAYIIKSIDSGNTWQYFDMSPYANALVEIYFLNEDVGFVSGKSDDGAIILKTTNAGEDWTEIFNSNIPGEYVWKLQVLSNDPDILFGSIQAVSPNLGKLVKSTDGGQTWNTYDAPETNIQAVGFVDGNHGWMGGHITGFYETFDGGMTWNNLNIGSNLNRIFIINPNLAYASGTSLYKFTDETLDNITSEKQDRTPLNIYIKKNPVSSLLEIEVNLISADNLVVELYDVNGKFIRQLALLKNHSANQTKHFVFSVEDLATGTYYINFHNNSGRESRKFIKI
ncbi:YCF48-related protein [Aestuariivivens sediminicola]|uniref:YCF48-related protein n=1 Tax=Aestuariivivens sediminicola TaxID=2913560 RepID=UPI001F5927D0|nr:YCF48-related protein [Aestuariivivens sediminicola]